jgi:hypothetical protein
MDVKLQMFGSDLWPWRSTFFFVFEFWGILYENIFLFQEEENQKDEFLNNIGNVQQTFHNWKTRITALVTVPVHRPFGEG